ncbi:MAG: hypothetical protein ACREBC_24070 [Pyrinomonadaceae bacterium]
MAIILLSPVQANEELQGVPEPSPPTLSAAPRCDLPELDRLNVNLGGTLKAAAYLAWDNESDADRYLSEYQSESNQLQGESDQCRHRLRQLDMKIERLDKLIHLMQQQRAQRQSETMAGRFAARSITRLEGLPH